jgi:hypothetical protein
MAMMAMAMAMAVAMPVVQMHPGHVAEPGGGDRAARRQGTAAECAPAARRTNDTRGTGPDETATTTAAPAKAATAHARAAPTATDSATTPTDSATTAATAPTAAAPTAAASTPAASTASTASTALRPRVRRRDCDTAERQSYHQSEN